MTRLLLLNGPMGCGKTELIKRLKQQDNWVDRRCKDKLFKLTQEFFCVDEETFFSIYENRELKEQPNDVFQISLEEYNRLADITGSYHVSGLFGKPEFVRISIREAMIYVSECLVKPAMGMDYFGVARAKSIKDGELAADDSAGFPDELPPVIESLGQESILLIRIFGRGDFQGDSRNYIPRGVINNTVDIFNDKTEQEFQEHCLKIINQWG